MEKLDQSPKVVQQILSRVPPPGGNFIQINYFNGELTEPKQIQQEEYKALPFCFDFEFEKFFEQLPKPRLRSLIGFVYQMMLRKFDGNATAASQYLGITYKTLWNFLEKRKTLTELME